MLNTSGALKQIKAKLETVPKKQRHISVRTHGLVIKELDRIFNIAARNIESHIRLETKKNPLSTQANIEFATDMTGQFFDALITDYQIYARQNRQPIPAYDKELALTNITNLGFWQETDGWTKLMKQLRTMNIDAKLERYNLLARQGASLQENICLNLHLSSRNGTPLRILARNTPTTSPDHY